jgi:N-acetylglucosamine-6-phosphate deacetylase
MKQRLGNCRLFDGERVHTGRDVLVEDGLVTAVIAAADKADGDYELLDLAGNLLAPGLIDLQVNGGGGILFNDAPTTDSLRTIGTAHRRFGTTSFLPTIITDSDEVMAQAMAALSTALDERLPGVLGIHLEGPYLNPQYKGVHDAARMRKIDDAAISRITSLRAGKTLLTLAPETVDANVITALSQQGVLVFAGHSAASYEQTRAALAAGLHGFTHLFNAMTPMQSRAPGMVGAALEDKDSYAGIIADGYHVHPAMFSIAVAAKAKGKMLLVTDAMPTVGADIDSFDLFGVEVRAEGGRCVTAEGTLAGADIGMITAVSNASRFAGIDITEALRMASTYVAEALGLSAELGYIRPGYRANLIELDESMQVRRSWIDGDLQQYAD